MNLVIRGFGRLLTLSQQSPACLKPLPLPTILSRPLLSPISPLLNIACGFKVKGKLRRRCKDCYIVVRDERTYIICPTHPRHKQMSVAKKEKSKIIMTPFAIQCKERPW